MSKVDWSKILDEAMSLEGKLSDCYRMFHNYSFGNQILAAMQVGFQPISTYRGWQTAGRQVKKGAKAIELCMPVTFKGEDEDDLKTAFIFRRNWFPLSDTEGEEVTMPEAIKFDRDRVLAGLGIESGQFEQVNGNVQGYAEGRTIHINPLAKYPLKTTWHEMAHILLEHTERNEDTATLTRNLIEVEAESVAYLLCNIFGYDEPKAESRGYIQHWKDTEGIPPANAKRIMKVVGQILSANKEKEQD